MLSSGKISVSGAFAERPMTLSIEEVQHIANLARLQLSPEEQARFREQLSTILDYVARLQELDTTGIPPASGSISGKSVLREDQARPGLSLEDLLRNAAQIEKGQFRVPPVFDGVLDRK
jgi:aspartyl-tRNA(Asn)/glutamyl-tRNA(Gln) amidotransferase subunit C